MGEVMRQSPLPPLASVVVGPSVATIFTVVTFSGATSTNFAGVAAGGGVFVAAGSRSVNRKYPPMATSTMSRAMVVLKFMSRGSAPRPQRTKIV